MNQLHQEEDFWEEEEEENIDKTVQFKQFNIDMDIESKKEQSILTTINAFWRKTGNTFNNFQEAVQNDSIPKFVMLFFNISSIENVHISESSNSPNLTKEQIENINAVIEFLKKRDNKFQLLRFDLRSSEKRKISSISFYSDFFNSFLLKSSKKELYQRCGTLLSKENIKFNDYDHFNELTDYKTFFALANFLYKRDLNASSFILNDDSFQQILESINVPMVINYNILEIGQKRNLPDSIFYQLQLLFDELDSKIIGEDKSMHFKYPSQHIVEILLKQFKNLQQIIVMDPSIINTSIKIKKKARKKQSKKITSYQARSSGSFSHINQFINNINKNTRDMPKSYKDRQEISKIENERVYKENYNIKNKISQNADSFWNKPNPDFCYEDGIICKNSKLDSEDLLKKSENDFTLEMSKVHDQETFNDFENVGQYNFEPNVQQNLYKLLIYNENEMKWEFNSNELDKFSKENFQNKNAKVTFILLLNSNEADSIQMISQLICCDFPDLKSTDEIFVYAVKNRNFSYFNPSFVQKFNVGDISPIFLLLHVPKSKQNLPNIISIAIQVYAFLSMWANFEIVILNKSQYYSQLLTTKIILSIADSYEQKLSNSVVDEFINNTPSFIYNKSKILFLINDEQLSQPSEHLDQVINQNAFFKQIKVLNGRNSQIHLYNSTKSETFSLFVDYIIESITHNFSELEVMHKNMQFINEYAVSNLFINLMIDKDIWREKLKNLINQRIEILKSENQNEISILSEIGFEITLNLPVFALEFISDCESILTQLVLPISQKNHDKISSELAISAESHMNYLKDEIKRKHFWTEQQMYNIINGHKLYLIDEYTNIIQTISVANMYEIIYNDNFDVLKNQYSNDKIKLNDIFKEFIDTINKKKAVIKKTKLDLLKEQEKGINYTMREIEHLREIKITVETDEDFEREIPQDF